MTDDRAILGSYAEWQMIKSRKVLVLKIEVPLEQAEEVLAKLGFPMPDTEIPVAVCRIDALAASEYRAQQRRSRLSVIGKERYESEDAMKQARDRACAYCRDKQFVAWADRFSKVLHVHDERTAKEFIYNECGISSRREIATDDAAYSAFLELETEYLEQTGQRAESR